MRIIPIIALTVSAANMAYADGGDTLRSRSPEEWHWVPSVGVVFNDQDMFDGSLLIAQYDYGGSCSFPTYAAYRVGFEYYDAKPAPIIAPKLGVEGDLIIFATRLTVVDYIQGDAHDLRLVPEIGFSFGPGLVQVLYGWNIPLTAERNPEIPPHRFAVAFNLDRRVVQEAFF